MREEDEVIRIYGPRFRTVVRENILDKLFTSQLTRIREDMRKVVRENNRINGHVGNARHRNKIYDPDGITSSWKKKIPLIPELALEMDKLIDENTTAQEENTRIYNYLPCTIYQSFFRRYLKNF